LARRYVCLLVEAGASNSRDSDDSRVIAGVKDATHHRIDRQREVGGRPEIATGPSPQSKSAVHTITAFAVGTRTVLRQISVDAKSNEIPAVPLLLQLLELDGAIVTLDAMHCQTETAQAIIAADADFILSVKANQRNLYKHLLDKFVEFAESDFNVEGLRRLITCENSHGRLERRTYYAIAVSDEDRKVLKRWPGLQSVGMVVRERTIGEKDELQTSFFITSLAPKVRALAAQFVVRYTRPRLS
jgi:hypothetical protein